MASTFDLQRFIAAQERDFPTALREISQGRKRSHWMWYIFPQLRGLGRSGMSAYYGIDGIEEAAAYLDNPCLASNLQTICRALLALDTNNPRSVFDPPDDKKLRSSMTLFAAAAKDPALYQSVLDKFFGGQSDARTLVMLKQR